MLTIFEYIDSGLYNVTVKIDWTNRDTQKETIQAMAREVIKIFENFKMDIEEHFGASKLPSDMRQIIFNEARRLNKPFDFYGIIASYEKLLDEDNIVLSLYRNRKCA